MTELTNTNAIELKKGQIIKITEHGFGHTKSSKKERVSICKVTGKRKSKKAVCGYKINVTVLSGFLSGSGFGIMDFEHPDRKCEIN